jgi:hypothetical protein
MRTFARRSPQPAANQRDPTSGRSARPRVPASHVDWSRLPDEAVLGIASCLDPQGRLALRAVCNGFRAGAGAAVQKLDLALSPRARHAAELVACAARTFGSCTQLALRFPLFALGTRQSPAGPLALPLASFQHLTRLELALARGGLEALPFDLSTARLPALTALTIRGLAAAAPPAGIATPVPGPASAATADASGGLGLASFAALRELTLDGQLSYRHLSEVGMVRGCDCEATATSACKRVTTAPT